MCHCKTLPWNWRDRRAVDFGRFTRFACFTKQEIRSAGYVAYWVREFHPYLKAAASQFSPRRETLTERMLRD